VLARNDLASREAGVALVESARAAGFSTGALEIHSPGMRDFAETLKQGSSAAAAWVAFGSLRDATGMLRSLKETAQAPRFLVLQAASEPEFVRLVGQDAEHVIGIAPWRAAVPTPPNLRFVATFRARWKEEPTLAAARGYSAGQLIEAAIRRAEAIDPERLRESLLQGEFETALGRQRFDPHTGAQMELLPMLTQIHRGRVEVIWPPDRATGTTIAELQPWRDRVPLRRSP
jgi:branched-chain amino acid transport system substrate-binding protein